jgi:hypothetical protein
MLRPEERVMAAEAAELWARIVHERPESPQEPLNDAKARIVALRDALLARMRREGAAPDDDLTAVNAALGLAWSAQLPLVGLRWERMRRTRDALRAMAEAGGGGSDPAARPAAPGPGGAPASPVSR